MSATNSFQKLIQEYNSEVQLLARLAQDLVLSVRPDARLEVEAAWGGYLLFKQPGEGANTVCFLSAHQKHVSLGFSQGAELDDPARLLQGKGKLQRHVKLKKPLDLERPELRELVKAAWSSQPDSEVLQDALERLREICQVLPETSETMSHGHPTFKVGKKSFAVYGIYSPSVAFKADVAWHAEVEGDDRFFPTPYLSHKGWLSVRIDGNTDWHQLRDLVRHSYKQVATRKQLGLMGE